MSVLTAHFMIHVHDQIGHGWGAARNQIDHGWGAARRQILDMHAYRGFELKPGGIRIIIFLRHYQIALKIKPLYLTNYVCYLTFNTTRVFRQY
jgi:hypothetical protein